MELKEKIKEFCTAHKISQEQLAQKLDMNYQVMNRNIAKNKLTVEFIIKMSEKFPKLDVNWLLREEERQQEFREPYAQYGIEQPIDILEDIERKIVALKSILSQ